MQRIIILMTFVGLMLIAVVSKKEIYLLSPTGQYQVGITTLDLIDQSRMEQFNTTQTRRLMLTLYYPATINREHRHLYMDIILKYTSIPELTFTRKPIGHSYDNPAISQDKKYPLVIFLPGFGAPIEAYSMLLEDIASHGYVVVGINFPYITNPVVFHSRDIVYQHTFKNLSPEHVSFLKQKIKKEWQNDVAFVIQELKKMAHNHPEAIYGHINAEAMAIMGHSFGAQVIHQLPDINTFFKAAITMEGKINQDQIHRHITIPFLLLMAPHSNAQDDQPILDFYHNLISRKVPAFLYTLPKASHGSFTDLPYISAQNYTDRQKERVTLKETKKIVINFLNKYLTSDE